MSNIPKPSQGIVCTGIVMLAIMQMWMAYLGHNGLYFALAAIAIALAIGIAIPKEAVLALLKVK